MDKRQLEMLDEFVNLVENLPKLLRQHFPQVRVQVAIGALVALAVWYSEELGIDKDGVKEMVERIPPSPFKVVVDELDRIPVDGRVH